MLLIDPCSSKAHCLWLYGPHLALHWRGDQRLVLRTRAAPVNTWTDKGRKDLSLASPTAGCDGTGPYPPHSPMGFPVVSPAPLLQVGRLMRLWVSAGHRGVLQQQDAICVLASTTLYPKASQLWTELISKLYGELWKIPEAELVFRSMALNARYQSGRQDGELQNHFF